MRINWESGLVSIRVGGKDFEVMQHCGKYNGHTFFVMEVSGKFHPEWCMHGMNLGKPVDTLAKAQQVCEKFIVTRKLHRSVA